MFALLDNVLKHFIKKGCIEVIFPDYKRRTYGDLSSQDKAGFHLLTYKICFRLIANPGLAFGEGYMDGEIKTLNCSIYDVLKVFLQNDLQHDHIGEKIASLLRFAKRSWSQLNRVDQARRNVAHHYDLKSSLYELFLGQDKQYSCAYFTHENQSLDQAQEAKKRHIAAKLYINKTKLSILDIGCGWGGMALYLAKNFDAEVTGITLSKEQLQVAKERAVAEGLQDRVHFELQDYRLINSKYDRVVSVGMFEHVGVRFYPEFFKSIKNLLKGDGIMLLHSIGRSDGPGSTNAWINKYIFPGGYSPSLSEVFAAIERSGLYATDCEILRLHYAKTIKFWRESIEKQKNKITKMYDERFYRMFDFYLSGCELTFLYQKYINFQIQLSPSLQALPITRNYMYEAEEDFSSQKN